MLNKLQKQSKRTRQAIAIFVSFFLTVMIFSVWVSTLSVDTINQQASLSNIDTSETYEYSRYGSLAGVFFNIKKGITETASLVINYFK